MLKKALISVRRRCIHYIGVLSKFCRGIKCIFLSIESVSEAREGGEEDVGMPGVGVVGDRGPGPSP